MNPMKTFRAACLLTCAAAAGCVGLKTPSVSDMEEAASQRSPAIGKPAPDFTLTNDKGTAVTLSALRGQWVVLYFYPKNDTPGCTCQATEFTKLLSRFRALDAEVIGISDDPFESHADFRKKYDLQITLLSDPKHQVMEIYGAWVITKLLLNSYGEVIRSTFLIDPAGIIAHHWPEVIPQGHAERVRRKLAEIQAGANR